MTGAEIAFAIGTPLICGVISFAVSWGYAKGESKTFITHPQHRERCDVVKKEQSEKRAEMYDVMREGFSQQNLKMDELIRAVGRIEGSLNGGRR